MFFSSSFQDDTFTPSNTEVYGSDDVPFQSADFLGEPAVNFRGIFTILNDSGLWRAGQEQLEMRSLIAAVQQAWPKQKL